MVVPWVNKEIMIKHLRQISMITEKDRHAVVIMDGAGWHTDDIAKEFENVSVIKLPPYSPELNPIQSFANYDDIVSKICMAWNQFLECGERVKNMCSRKWIELTS